MTSELDLDKTLPLDVQGVLSATLPLDVQGGINGGLEHQTTTTQSLKSFQNPVHPSSQPHVGATLVVALPLDAQGGINAKPSPSMPKWEITAKPSPLISKGELKGV